MTFRVETAEALRPLQRKLRILPRNHFLEDDSPFAVYVTTRQRIRHSWISDMRFGKGNTKHRRSRRYRRARRAWHRKNGGGS